MSISIGSFKKLAGTVVLSAVVLFGCGDSGNDNPGNDGGNQVYGSCTNSSGCTNFVLQSNCLGIFAANATCPVITQLYCDFGPVTQWGGGCFQIQNASECDTEYGRVVTTCGSGGVTPDPTPVYGSCTHGNSCVDNVLQSNCTGAIFVANGTCPATSQLYCDFGPVTEWGGGCFQIQNASECDTEYGRVVTTCGSGGVTPDPTPVRGSCTIGSNCFPNVVSGDCTGTFVENGTCPVVPTPTAPSTPTGLTAVRSSPTSSPVTICWNAVSGATSYQMYLGRNSTANVEQYATKTDTCHVDHLSSTITTYYFSVAAVNSAGESPRSSWVSVEPMSGGTQPPPTVTGSCTWSTECVDRFISSITESYCSANGGIFVADGWCYENARVRFSRRRSTTGQSSSGAYEIEIGNVSIGWTSYTGLFYYSSSAQTATTDYYPLVSGNHLVAVISPRGADDFMFNFVGGRYYTINIVTGNVTDDGAIP